MDAMNLNTDTYVLPGASSSSSITLTPEDRLCTSLVIYNAGTVAVFLVSGTGSAPTAVFPTSATVPLQGKVIGPGVTATFTKRAGHEFISGITASGTASTYIAVGTGE